MFLKYALKFFKWKIFCLRTTKLPKHSKVVHCINRCLIRKASAMQYGCFIIEISIVIKVASTEVIDAEIFIVIKMTLHWQAHYFWHCVIDIIIHSPRFVYFSLSLNLPAQCRPSKINDDDCFNYIVNDDNNCTFSKFTCIHKSVSNLLWR